MSDFTLLAVVGWIVGAIGAAAAFRARGRGAGAGFGFGAVIGAPLALILGVAAPDAALIAGARAVADGAGPQRLDDVLAIGKAFAFAGAGIGAPLAAMLFAGLWRPDGDARPAHRRMLDDIAAREAALPYAELAERAAARRDAETAGDPAAQARAQARAGGLSEARIAEIEAEERLRRALRSD